MKKRNYFLFIFLILFSNACIAQKKVLSDKEQSCINLFNHFLNYLDSTINKKEDIGDNAHLKYILLNYIFINKKLDSLNQITISDKELMPDQIKILKKELNDFFNFLRNHQQDHLAENLTLMPIRFSYDKSVYERLTDFQKVNTFVLCDKRFPDTPINYILFITPLKNVIDSPRIWSWTLVFKFGKYMFKSAAGDEGYEYIFKLKN